MPADREELLRRLADTPRENGDEALHETATFLADVLREAGTAVELVPFIAHPYGTRLLGVFVMVCGLAYAWLLWRRRWRAALGIAVVLPAIVVLQGQLGVPVLGWPGALEEHNVVATLPVADATQRLVLSAHYDTKTDLFDHVVRTPVYLLAPLAAVLLLLGPLAARAGQDGPWPRVRRWARRLAIGTGLVYCPANFLAASAGMLVPERSRGALDDGAACIVLVELARELVADPPARTEIQLVFFAGEELGIEGAKAWVDGRLAADPLPTTAINLDPIGASTDLAIIRAENTMLGSHDADPDVVALLQRVHRAHVGDELPLTPLGGTTDGVAFRRRDIPAATLMSSVPPWQVPRGLHSAADTRARIDPAALDFTRGFLRAVVDAVDRGR